MEVLQLSDNSFVVRFTEKRLIDIKRISTGWEISTKGAIADVIEHGIDILLEGLERKES